MSRSPSTPNPSLPGMAAMRPRPSTAPGYKRRNPERDEQVALFRWIDAHTRLYPSLGTVFAIPNGLALLPGVAGQARAQGVRSGVWDLHCPLPAWVYPGNPLYPEGEVGGVLFTGLWIEMKIKPNKLSLEQQGFQSLVGRLSMEKADHAPCFVVAYTLVQAATAILNYLDIRDERVREGLR